MKRFLAFLCVALMMVQTTVIAAPDTYPPEEAPLKYPVNPQSVAAGNTIVIEGEDMTIVDSRVVSVKSDSNASGGKYISIDASAHNLDGGAAVPNAEIRYTVHFDKPGMYEVWARVIKNASFYYSLDGGKTYTAAWGGATSDEPYSWVKLGHPGVFSGKLDICFAHRYSTTRIDKILITTDAAFQPKFKDDYPTYDTTGYYPLPPYNPPANVHPRVYISEEDIPRITANLNEPILAPHKEYLRNQARYTVNSVMNGSFDSSTPARIRARALWWITGNAGEGETAYNFARDTIRYALEYLTTAEYPNVGDITRQTGDAMEMGAVIYDWMYDLLTEEEKHLFIATLKSLANSKEGDYPIVGNLVYGHNCEKEIFRDLLSVGIAIYDEDPEVWNLAAGAYFADMVSTRHLYNAAGNHPSGDAYGGWRLTCELMSEMLLRNLDIPLEERVGKDIWNVPMRWIYSRKPTGGVFREGDTSTPKYFEYQLNRTPELIAAIANMYPDAPNNDIIYGEWRMNEALLPSHNKVDMFHIALLWDKDNPNEVSLGTDLPLSYASGYPLSQVYARTSWQRGLDAPTAMAFMQLRETMVDVHTHPDLGQFQIYYKGTLANDSTGPQSAGGWLTTMDANWARRSIAHNVITVKDPEEVFFDNYYYEVDWKDWNVLSNDGGQNIELWYGTKDMKSDEDFYAYGDLTTKEGLYIGPNKKTPEFSYGKTDLTNVYGGRRVNKDTGKLLREDIGFANVAGTVVKQPDIVGPDDLYHNQYVVIPKISDYKRSMVFIDLFDEDYPAAFVVFDKVDSANADFEKNFLLHMLEEPVVNGNTTVVRRTLQGHNGKMVMKTLLPANPDIEIIGGAGKSTYVDGKNYGDVTDSEREEGGWRIEVSPSAAAKNDLFLHAMYVTDNDRNLPELPMTKLETDKFVGVTVKDRVVMFSKDALPVEGTFAINIPDNNNGGNMSVLITDVAPGMWQVKNGTSTQIVEVTEDGNALYFKGASGTYTISPSTETAATAVTYPATEKSEVGDFAIYSSDGLYRYQKYPTADLDGVPYVCAESFLPYYGTEVSANSNGTYTFRTSSVRYATVTPDSNQATINGTATILPHTTKMLNGKLYICPMDFEDALNVSSKYIAESKMLKVTISTDIEDLITAAGGNPEKVVIPVSAAADSGADTVSNTFDWQLGTNWTVSGLNKTVTYDLGNSYDLDCVMMAFVSGNARQTIFDIQVSSDGVTWKDAFSGRSSGTTDLFEKFTLENANGVRFVKFLGNGNTANTQNAIKECLIIKK